MKNGPVAEAGKGHDHISPEQQDIGSFREFQVTEQHEKCRLQEKKQSHFDQVAGKSHKSDGECEEAKDAEHACQEKSPFPMYTRLLNSIPHYTRKSYKCKRKVTKFTVCRLDL